MSVIVHISMPVFYQFEGWLFEYDRRKPFGPWPLKKGFEPRARAGKRFYDMFERFCDLPESVQERHRL